VRSKFSLAEDFLGVRRRVPYKISEKEKPMRFILSALLVVPVLALFPACASNNAKIFSGEGGGYIAKADEREREDALDEASEGAEEFCKKQGKRAIFMKDETKYTGTMDENTRKVVRNASKAGVMLGGYGSPVGKAGQGGMMMTNDKDYRAELHFKCE
jgi:hypothetical protein